MAIEGIKGGKTLAEIATEYQVHPIQILDWKKQRLPKAPEVFSSRRKREAPTEAELTAPLYEEIRRLKMDVKWLEKASSLPVETRRSWVSPDADYSIWRQRRLAGVPRSRFYYEAVPEPNVLSSSLSDDIGVASGITVMKKWVAPIHPHPHADCASTSAEIGVSAQSAPGSDEVMTKPKRVFVRFLFIATPFIAS